jgi:hypothetical protein
MAVPYGIPKSAELDSPVAEDVWTGCTSPFELRDGVGDNPLIVLLLHRDYVKGYPCLLAHSTGKAQVFLPRAVSQERYLVFQPDLQIVGFQPTLARSEYLVQGNGAVHPARE